MDVLRAIAGTMVAEMFIDGPSHAVVSLSRFQRSTTTRPPYLPPILIPLSYSIVIDALA